MEDPKTRLNKIIKTVAAEYSEDYKKIINDGEITVDGKTVEFEVKQFGVKPAEGYALFIGLSPKGETKADGLKQYQAFTNNYKMPDGSIWLSLKAPGQQSGLWHESYIDDLLIKLISCFNTNALTNPNRIYLCGYTDGGDGVYKLAPRLASCFAAAGVMGGHPNKAALEGLRNLPFSIQCGKNDNTFYRNKVNKEYADLLNQLKQRDPGGYDNFCKFHHTGHRMMLKENKVFPWMSTHTRQPYPDFVVWKQDAKRLHTSLYYLKVGEAEPGSLITCLREGNSFFIESKDVKTIQLFFNDYFVDLDQEIFVTFNKLKVFSGKLERDWSLVRKTFSERLDPHYSFYATVTVEKPEPKVEKKGLFSSK